MRAIIFVLTIFTSLMLSLPVMAADTTSSTAHNHYDPAALNELALTKLQEGDMTTAEILLERAARLAPYDQRILQNLSVLRAQKQNAPLPISRSQIKSVETNDLGHKDSETDKSPQKIPPLWK
jgi:hypothetical protein